jgi:hypothetical protein
VRLGFRFSVRQPDELREELGTLAKQIAEAAEGALPAI